MSTAIPLLDQAEPMQAAGVAPRGRFQELVQQVQRQGWDAAWWEFALSLAPAERAAAEEDLGLCAGEGWQYFVSLPPATVALECGAGVGPLSLSLADKVAELCCFDPDAERLQLLAARAEERGLDHVRCIHADPARPLPFPDQSFDLVNLNGVLQSLAADKQRRLLREIRRILKPAGQVFAGMDNRFALQNLRSSLRSDSYTAAGLRRLFQQAGFAEVQFLVLSPDARLFDRVMSLDAADQIASLFTSRHGWKGWLKHLLVRTGQLARLAPSFGVIASPTMSLSGPVAPLDELVRQINRKRRSAYEVEKISVREHGGCVALLHSPTEPGTVLKLTFADGRDERLTQTSRNAARMAETLPGGTSLVPRTLEQGTHSGHAYALEERLPGCNGFQLLERGWPSDKLAATVWDVLEPWQRSTRRQVRLSQSEFERWIPREPERWQRFAGPRAARTLETLWSCLGAYFVGQERTLVASHGDFWLGNLLFREDRGEICGLIDWDSADELGLPLVDGLSLGHCPGLERPADMAWFDVGFSDSFGQERSVAVLLEALRRVSYTPHPRLQRLRSEYGYTTDLDVSMALLMLFWKRHQPGHLAARRHTSAWLEAFRLLLANPAERITDLR